MNKGIITTIVGIISIAISFVVYPIVLDAADTILLWPSVVAGTFTGLEAVVKVSPLLVFVGLLAGGVFAMYTGVRSARSSGKRGD